LASLGAIRLVSRVSVVGFVRSAAPPFERTALASLGQTASSPELGLFGQLDAAAPIVLLPSRVAKEPASAESHTLIIDSGTIAVLPFNATLTFACPRWLPYL
jgi:hypothetical protein